MPAREAGSLAAMRGKRDVRPPGSKSVAHVPLVAASGDDSSRTPSSLEVRDARIAQLEVASDNARRETCGLDSTSTTPTTCRAAREASSGDSRPPSDARFRDGLFLFLAGRLPVHFSTVFPLERRDMVIDGAAERRLQAIHRDRCTC